jgi:hypothetical protein
VYIYIVIYIHIIMYIYIIIMFIYICGKSHPSNGDLGMFYLGDGADGRYLSAEPKTKP